MPLKSNTLKLFNPPDTTVGVPLTSKEETPDLSFTPVRVEPLTVKLSESLASTQPEAVTFMGDQFVFLLWIAENDGSIDWDIHFELVCK